MGTTINFSEIDRVRWQYNIDDCIYTHKIASQQRSRLANQNEKFQESERFQQEELVPCLIRMMNRGIRIDLEKKEFLNQQLTGIKKDIESKLNWLLDESFNPRSTPQLRAVFKDLLGIKLKVDRKSKTESCASPYMFQYLEEYPEYRALISLILEYRSVGVFLKTFVQAKVDEDGRMRTAYNAAGTKTFRLASRKNAFGFGANLANIPSKGKIKLRYALEDFEETSFEENEEVFIDDEQEGLTALPNCKEFFIPDKNYVFWNADYNGADAMVVAWDSRCEWSQNFFANTPKTSYGKPFKLYQYLASHYLQREVDIRKDELGKYLIPTDGIIYDKQKAWTHGSHYGMQKKKAALSSGMSEKDSDKLHKWYFAKDKCKRVLDWHIEIEETIKKQGYIQNAFGARGWFLNYECPTRMNQAIAWKPQSTIGVETNKGIVNIDKFENPDEIHPLMQVHDAGAGQHHKDILDARERIIKHMSVVVPYDDPLVIPVDYSESSISYGHCK